MRSSFNARRPTGDGYVSMFVAISDEFGSFGDIAFWAEGTEPYAEAPTWIASSSTVEGDASGVTATFELVEFDETQEPPFGDPAGTAVLTVALAPDGDPFAVDDRFRNGNRWERVSGTIQPLSLDGSLVLPGADLETLVGCTAEEQNLTYFSTNPSAYTDRFREFTISCSWESGTDSVNMFVHQDSFGSFGEVYVSGPQTDIGGGTDIEITDTSFGFTVELFDNIAGEPAGSAEATGTFAPTGEFFRFVDEFGVERVKVRGEAYTVAGSLDMTLGSTTTTYPIDDEHCEAAEQVVAVHAVVPNGPKPGPIANDAPGDARALRLGRTARVVTGGTRLRPRSPARSKTGDR